MSVLELKPWLVVEFPHFVGVRHRNGPWTNVYLDGGFEIPIEKLGLRVELTNDAIVFSPPPEPSNPTPSTEGE